MKKSDLFIRRLLAGFVIFAALGFSASSALPVSAGSSGLRDIGLVLSGGGAKGAYEVGVWRTLVDWGLSDRIAAISGTSVGAINAAAFASGLPSDRIEALWSERLGGIFVIRDVWIRDNFEDWFQAAQADESKGKWRTTVGPPLHGAMSLGKLWFGSGPLDGALDSSSLEKALISSIPAKWSADSPVVFASAVARNGAAGPALEVFRLNEADSSTRVAMMCASAAIPFAYPARRVGKKYYLDGGMSVFGFPGRLLNPAPLTSYPQVKTIIAVYLDDEDHLDSKTRLKESDIPVGAHLVEIIPSENIGGAFFGWKGVFDASPNTAKRLIELGSKDAEKVLKEKGLWQERTP